MINISNTLVINAKPQKILYISIQKSVFGLGISRTRELERKLTGRLAAIPIKMFIVPHFRWLTYQIVKNSFILKEKLRSLRRANIKRLKLLNCYRGIRHILFLPTRGQRTKSNAITSRFLGSGSFDYVPRQPGNFFKKIGSYVRRKLFLKKLSESRYKHLLARNFVLFQQQRGGHLTRFLDKKGKLGVFSKLIHPKKVKKVKN